MTKIVRCEVTNILGAKSVSIEPNGKSVTIGGANGQGKSSTILALVAALGGKSKLPKEPVTHGAQKGEVVVELEDYIVFLEVDPDRTTKLRVESRDGARKRQSPQSMLDALFGNLAFDPGVFKSMSNEKRLQTLTELVGLDFAKLDAARKKAFEERTIIGRELSSALARIKDRKPHSDAPEFEIVPSDVMNQLQQCFEIERERELLSSNIESIKYNHQRLLIEHKRTNEELSKLREKLDAQLTDIDRLAEEFMTRKAQLEALPESQVESYKQQLTAIESTNVKVRENKEFVRLQDENKRIKALYDKAEQRLEDIDSDRKAKVAAAQFPIAGMEIVQDDVLFNGVGFSQLSESEQWELSTAISFALNKKGIVFMSNCGGLDRKSRDRVRQRAADLGVQLFLEVVDDADDVEVLISEGEVVENRLTV